MVDVGYDICFRPGVRLATVKTVIVAVAVLGLAWHQVHGIAIYSDINRNVLPGGQISLLFHSVEQFVVNFLQCFRGLL